MVCGMTTATLTESLTIAALDDGAAAQPAASLASTVATPGRDRGLSTARAVQRTSERRRAQAEKARVVYGVLLLPIGAAALIGVVLLSLTLISYFTHLPA